MLAQSSSAMHFLMALGYAALLALVVEYIHLLAVDPSDPRLQEKNYLEEGVEEK